MKTSLSAGAVIASIGLIILIFPDIIAYILGGVLLFSGLSIVIASILSSSESFPQKKSWKWGSYEIIRKNK